MHATCYRYSEPVSLCHNEVHLAPRNTARQTCISHELTIEPAAPKVDDALDYFGNHVSFFTLQERHQELAITATSQIRLLPAAYLAPESTPAWASVRDARSPRPTASRRMLRNSVSIRPWCRRATR